MREFDYNSREWRHTATAAIRRDASRCTVARLLGGTCHSVLHAHHIESPRLRPELAYDLDNVATVCAAHHPKWEAIRRAVVERRGWRRCPHAHPTAEGRAACERQLNAGLEREPLTAA